ncbi:hypothetical protein UJ39_17070 [Salmonella enterica subsp. enterica serovar Tennessee]|nr:hypothetical protein [Salmonella enterica subsp. enterica serovar Tennessee]
MSTTSPELWSNIGYVTSGFSLLAFVVAGFVSAYKIKLSHFNKLVRSSSGKDRLDVIERILHIFSVDTDSLTKEQKYNIVIEQIKIRRHQLNLQIFTFCFISLLFAGVAYASIINADKLRNEIIDPETKNETSTSQNGNKKHEVNPDPPTPVVKNAIPEFNGVNKFLRAPLGLSSSSLIGNVPGEWRNSESNPLSNTAITEQDNGIYISFENLFDVHFSSEISVYKTVKAVRLLKDNGYETTKSYLNGQYTKKDTSINKADVDNSCFGGEYNQFNQNLHEYFGNPYVKKSTEDKSNELAYLTLNCKSTNEVLGTCGKSKTIEKIDNLYKKDGYVLRFIATRENIERLETKGSPSYIDSKIGRCSWEIKYTHN